MSSYLKKIVLLIVVFSFLTFSFAEAITIENPLEAETFEELIESLLDFIFVIAIAIVPIMIIVGGFYFLTSGGDPNKVRTAKSIVLWTIVGLAIVLLAKGIISVIKQIIGG